MLTTNFGDEYLYPEEWDAEDYYDMYGVFDCE